MVYDGAEFRLDTCEPSKHDDEKGDAASLEEGRMYDKENYF